MKQTLADLRKKAVIGFVGGSDLSKQYEQLGESSKYLVLLTCWSFNWLCPLVLKDFDFCFAENGLTAYRLGTQLQSQVNEWCCSRLQWIEILILH